MFMICGGRSFGHQDKNAEGSFIKTQRKSKRSLITSFRKIIINSGKNTNVVNPYAERGLDKFYALVAELEDKKQQIYTKIGPEHVSFVRFVYNTNDDSVKPIIVRVNKTFEKKSGDPILFINQNQVTKKVVVESPKRNKEELGDKKRSNESSRVHNNNYYFPVMVVVLILVFLAISGRSFAIMCTSILCYLVPNNYGVHQWSSASPSSKNVQKKKNLEYGNNKVRIDEKNNVHSDGPSSPVTGSK